MLTLNSTELFHHVDKLIDDNFSKYVSWRRHLHANPEISWEESNTTQFVRDQLEDLQLSAAPGPRQSGCFTDIDFSQTATRCIALRADIDAIPVCEANEFEYRSRNPEVMHACGHDVHTSILLATCHVLQMIREQYHDLDLPVSIRAIFQPAEEVAQGAAEFIDAGVLDGVDQILALHVDPLRRLGRVGLKRGTQTAHCDEIKVHISADGGHGARPYETSDPILTASQFINAVYAQIPRSYDNRKAAVLSFCSIQSGHSANVIPSKCELHGTLRSMDEEQRSQIKNQLEQIASSIASAFGARIDVQYGVELPSVSNHASSVELFENAALADPDPFTVDSVDVSLGGEDFAHYLRHVPGALARLGSASNDRHSFPLHSPHFDVDERVIREGCRLLVRASLVWAHPKLLPA